QARGRRLRPRRKAAGAADDQDDAAPRRGAVAARRGGCPGGCRLPYPLAAVPAHRAGDGGRLVRACAQGRIELAALPSVIAHLRGTILEKHPNRVVVDVGGVGYDVALPLSTFYGLADVG